MSQLSFTARYEDYGYTSLEIKEGDAKLIDELKAKKTI